MPSNNQPGKIKLDLFSKSINFRSISYMKILLALVVSKQHNKLSEMFKRLLMIHETNYILSKSK